MIKNENGILTLDNGRVSYSIWVSPKRRIPVHLHFGPSAKPEIEDVLKEMQTNFQLLDGDDFKTVDGIYDGLSPVEVGSHLRMDLRPSSAIVEMDGKTLTDFRVKGIEHKAPQYPAYWPYPRHIEGEEWLCLVLEDINRPGLLLELYYCLLSDMDVLLRASKVINKTGKRAIVRKLGTCFDFPFSFDRLEHLPGEWAGERHLEKSPLPCSTITLTSAEGRSGHAENPYFSLHSKGLHYGFNQIYSGTTINEITTKFQRITRASVLFGGPGFAYRLDDGEELTSPLTVASFSTTYSGLISTNHEFVRNHIVPDSGYGEKDPIVFNSWEGAMMDFDTASMLQYANAAKDIGADIFVLDDGWFSTRNDDRHGLGDWRINESKIDLRKLSEHVRSLGMDFGLWLEFEMANVDAPIYQKDHSVALGGEAKERLFSRNQLVLDFSRREVVDSVLDDIFDSLKEIKLDYIKLDMNRVLGDYVSAKTREGEIEYRYVDNLYYAIDRMIRHFGLKLFESCASGGGRFDLGMLCFSRVIWTSDNTNADDRALIQSGTALAYPLLCLSSHVSSSRSRLEDKCNVALFGTYGYEMDPRKLTTEQKEILKQNREIYDEFHADCVVNGDYFELYSPFDTDKYVALALSKDCSKGLLLFFSLASRGPKGLFVRIPGLKEGQYLVDGKLYDQSTLANIGLSLSFGIPYGESRLITIRKAK